MITSMMDQIKISKSSPDQKDSSNIHDHNAVFPANKSVPSLDSGQYTKNGIMFESPHVTIFCILSTVQ